MKRIHIIGSVGSGKTTLAKTLSSKLTIPYYELDNVVWQRTQTGDIRRSEQERDEYLQKVIMSDCWIIEGAHHKWVLPSFQKADLIIFLDTPIFNRKYRIIKRFIFQKLGLEKANYQPSFAIFKKMFVWNNYFERISKPEIMGMLHPFLYKLLVLTDNTKVDELLNGGDHRDQSDSERDTGNHSGLSNTN
ncbi:EutP/PduV family microcompartment system protein [Pseudoneobacillus sp. C159]